MTGILAALLSGGSLGPISSSLSAWTGGATGPTGNTGTALLQFNTDGSITKTITGVGFSGGITGPTQWASNVVAGVGTGVWIRASSVVGNAVGSTAFVQLTSNQLFGYSAQLADRSATFTLDFSLDASTVILSIPANSLFVTHI